MLKSHVFLRFHNIINKVFITFAQIMQSDMELSCSSKSSVETQKTSIVRQKSTFGQSVEYVYSPSEEERKAIFVSSCIETAAATSGMEADAMYKRMQRIGLIDNYILPCYETLHAESRENVTRDILKTIEIWEKKKGIA